MAEGANADGQAGDVADDDGETIVALRGDLMKRPLHAQRDLLAGFAIHELGAQIPANNPLPQDIGGQAGLSRRAIASAHRRLGQGRDNFDPRPYRRSNDRSRLA